MSTSLIIKSNHIISEIEQKSILEEINNLIKSKSLISSQLMFQIIDKRIFGDMVVSKNIFNFYDDFNLVINILKEFNIKYDCDWEVSIDDIVGEIKSGRADSSLEEMLLQIKTIKENQLKKEKRSKWQPKTKGTRPKNKNKKGENLDDFWVEKGLIDLRESKINNQFKISEFNDTNLSCSSLNGKFKFKNSILDFSELNGEIHFMENCSCLDSKIHLSLNTMYINDFSFKDNNFSYSKITHFTRMLCLESGPFVENCIFDFCIFKTIEKVHFKKCSFKNSNFNNSEIPFCIFENCDFTDASFDSTFYSKTRFINCIGIDKNKMIDYFPVIYGEIVGNEEDIILE